MRNKAKSLGLHRDSSGVLRDKYGRPMEEDWNEFDKLKGKRVQVIACSSKLKIKR